MTDTAMQKILIIDDHIETLQIIAKVLDQHGFVTIKARSGQQGLALVAEKKPDLILLDGMMPEMNGWEVCRRLREDPRFAPIPIIMFSAVDEAEQKLAGFDAGADDYLTKPTEPDELIERVTALLANQPAVPAAPAGLLNDPTSLMETMTLTAHHDVIAVMGSRGGAGATTLAINLATALAGKGQPTTLIDMGAPGHIALYLSQKTHRNFRELHDFDLEAIPAQLDNYLVPYTNNLHLLLQNTELDEAASLWSVPHQHWIMDILLQKKQTLVLDIGSRPQAIWSAVLPTCGTLLLCTPAERVALTAARQRLTELDPELIGKDRSGSS
jgi:CheY-like chemotaxis protein